jgi:hypothetical protein
MSRPSRVAALALAVAMAACGEETPSTPARVAPPTSAPRAHRESPEAARDPRLRDDCGGWEPSADLLDEAMKPGALDALPLAHRIDVLRAGLRLADDAAARACAVRLHYEWIDRWECARCVDLIIAQVLTTEDDGTYEQFRSYLGSVDLTRFLRALPPTPWTVEIGRVFGDSHRIARADALPAYLEVARAASPEVAAEALEMVAFLGRWNDDLREEVQAAFLSNAGAPTVDAKATDDSGLPPRLAAWLRWEHLRPKEDGPKTWTTYLAPWDRRWLWDCTPGPRDAQLLMELTAHGNADPTQVAGAALVLLGRLHDADTDSFLRARAGEERLARWALARRGDRAMLDGLVADTRRGEEFALALLMEVDPTRARTFLDETLLGEDDGPAGETLDALASFATPGAPNEPLGFAWRRTSLDGLDRAAVESRISARRLARIAVIAPGCRTCAVAEAIAARLRPGDLVSDGQDDLDPDDLAAMGALLETGAPETARVALRRVAEAGGPDAERATRWGVKLGDPEAAARFVAIGYKPGWLPWEQLALTRAPQVRRVLEERVSAWLAGGSIESLPIEEVGALAVFHGLREDVAAVFNDATRAAVESVLAGRPADAVAEIVAANPHQQHGPVGAVDDPRVRAYLLELRDRRDLGHHWYAVGQLAALGDPSAREEFWGAMKDGRYRIMNDPDVFERTLGGDVASTMPFWIEELRSQCCRIVTGGAGDIVEKVLGLPIGEPPNESRTNWRVAKELWDSAGGRFVRSRIAGHWVPAPR